MEVTKLMDDRPIPKLGAPTKDTNRLHKNPPPSKEPEKEHPEEERPEKTMGLRRSHTTDSSVERRRKSVSPRSSRRTRRPDSGSPSAREERVCCIPSPTACDRGTRSQSPKGRGSPSSSRTKERSSRRLRVTEDLEQSWPSPNRRSPSGERHSPTRNNGRHPRSQRIKKEPSATPASPLRRLGTIEARRQKSARTNGLRRSKSLEENNGDLDLSWRRFRRDRNASSGGAGLNFNASSGRLEQSSSNFLDSASGDFLDSDLDLDKDDDDDDISIDVEVQKSNAQDNSTRNNKSRNRGHSPRHRTNKNRSEDISRNQLARGIELQDQRVREEEAEEAKRRLKNHRTTKEPSFRNRSRSPTAVRNREQSINLFSLAAPKITAPRIVAPKIVLPSVGITGSAMAAATAASQAANRAAVNAGAAAAVASATANQMALGATATATAAANLMSGAAERAAAAMAIKTAAAGSHSAAIGPAPRPDSQTIDLAEVAERLARAKTGSSQFRGSSNGFNSSSTRPGSSSFRGSSDAFRSSTGSNTSPSRRMKSEEFTAGNGLQLF